MYKKHCDNLKILDKSIKLTQQDLRRYISMEQKESVYIYTKILSYLVICWTEVRILKLAYEPSFFSATEIKSISSSSTLEQKWITALNISICRAYRIIQTNEIDVVECNLPFTAKARYKGLISLIKTELLDSIEVRNRVAHGQWLFAFTNDLSSFSQDLTKKLRTENIVKLQLRVALFKSLAQIIHDLAVSPTTFDRDFDMNYRKIEQQKLNFHKREYDKYEENMIAKYQRGIVKRNFNN